MCPNTISIRDDCVRQGNSKLHSYSAQHGYVYTDDVAIEKYKNPMDRLLHHQLLAPLLSTSPDQLLFLELKNTTDSQYCKTTVDLQMSGMEAKCHHHVHLYTHANTSLCLEETWQCSWFNPTCEHTAHIATLTMMLRNIGAIKAHTMPLSWASQQLRMQRWRQPLQFAACIQCFWSAVWYPHPHTPTHPHTHTSTCIHMDNKYNSRLLPLTTTHCCWSQCSSPNYWQVQQQMWLRQRGEEDLHRHRQQDTRAMRAINTCRDG